MIDTSSMPPANGVTSSTAEAESPLAPRLPILCHDPDDHDAPCPVCGGKGVITLQVPISDARFGLFQRCPNNPVYQDHALQERFRRFAKLEAYRDKTFDSFQTDLLGGGYTPGAIASLADAKRLARDFANDPAGWMLLRGKYGCGKTHLAVAIANHRLQMHGEQVYFITAPDLLDLLRATFSARAEPTLDETFQLIRDIPLLILDDLGAENPSPWAKEKLFQLLNHRHVERLPTVITTDADLDELDPRLASRMQQESVVMRVDIQAPDFRQSAPNRGGNARNANMQLYRGMRFDSFSVRSLYPEEEPRLRDALKMAKNWAAEPDGWLYIMGEYGAGKTHLAAAIALDLHERGRDVTFTTVPELLDFLRQAFDPRANQRFDQRFGEIVNAPFLVLDDLRLASATPWARDKLFQIIEKRYLSRAPTVFTSSDTMDETDARLATRLMDRRVCKPYALRVRSYVKRLAKRS